MPKVLFNPSPEADPLGIHMAKMCGPGGEPKTVLSWLHKCYLDVWCEAEIGFSNSTLKGERQL